MTEDIVLSSSLKPKLLSDDFTLLKSVRFLDLPKDELLHATNLVWRVPDMLCNLIKDFGTAIEIYDFAFPQMQSSFGSAESAPDVDSLDRWLGWMAVAGRDGAQTIFHFVRLIEETKSITFQKCPTINKSISRDRRNQLNDLIRLYFKGWRDLRDAVAHRVEFQQSMERIAEHAPETGDHYGQGGWLSRRFHVHNKKRTLVYELSKDTQLHLVKTREAYCNLFRN